MKLRNVLIVLALIPALQACLAAVAAVAVGVGYVQYERNEIEREIPLPFERTYEAVSASLNILGYPEERKEEVTSTEVVVEVEDLWVRVEQLPEGKSRMRVRVGTFATKDHERRGRLIFEQTFHELGLDPPTFDDEAEPVAAQDHDSEQD